MIQVHTAGLEWERQNATLHYFCKVHGRHMAYERRDPCSSSDLNVFRMESEVFFVDAGCFEQL